MRNILRNRKCNGIKRYRQFPICIGEEGKYRWFYADFFSYALQMILEVDG